MDKKLLGQGMIPSGAEAANDTFFFHEYELSKEMGVCPECGEISGLLRLRGGGPFYSQTCLCPDKRGTPEAHEELRSYLRLDFATAVTLCACCGQELIKTGSKFSSFYCDFCRKLVLAFDRKRGFTLIPMGMHSFMNGVLLNGRDAQDEVAINKFVEGMSSMFKRTELLEEWTKNVTAANIKMTGHDWGDHIGLFDYLSEMPRDFRSRHNAFLGLRKFFLERCEAAPETRSAGGETTMALDGGGQDDPSAAGQAAGAGAAIHNPETEIRSSSYVLVARMQAVRRKWRHGLNAYLRKYGCQFNEVIATNNAATLEFDDQLIDLAENGLEMDKDFTIIYAGDAGGAGIKKDGTPFPMPVDWLGGFYHNDSAWIFLKQ